MGYFTKKTTWVNWQLGVFKWSMISLGILLGTYFAAFWKPILWLIWIIFVITAIWVTIIWLKAMQNQPK